MRKDRKDYPQVENLPAGSVPVKDYSIKQDISITWVYKLHAKGSIKIVNHYGKNYVTPNE